MWYHYDVRRAVHCVKKEWRTVMPLLLPGPTASAIGMATNESTNHIFGTIVGINIPSKIIHLLSFENIRSIAYISKDDHFARLLCYYQQDAVKSSTLLTSTCWRSVDSDIGSWVTRLGHYGCDQCHAVVKCPKSRVCKGCVAIYHYWIWLYWCQVCYIAQHTIWLSFGLC